MDTFLVEVSKKSIGDNIRWRNKEKKFQCETGVQDVISDLKPLVSSLRTSETVDIADSNLSCNTKSVNQVHRFSENSSFDSLPPIMNDMNS